MDGDNSVKSHQAKVQFSDEINTEHSSNIQVQLINEFLINVHLGFLQIRHRYEIVFTFESSESMEKVFDPDSAKSLHAKIIELKSIKTNNNSKDKPPLTVYRVTAELFAHKENLLKERVCFGSPAQDNRCPTFVFNARVLGNGKGTPFLKKGIKCIGIEADENDEISDFG